MNAHINGRNVTVTAEGADTPELRAAMRKAACGEAHTATIGKLLKADDAGGKLTLTWGPVTTREGAAKAAPVKDAPRLTGDASVVPNLADMSKRELREEIARLRSIIDDAPAPKRDSAFIAEQRAKRAAITCKTCADHGVVRGVGANAGKPYRTANGAAAATAAGRSVKCPSHKRASKAA